MSKLVDLEYSGGSSAPKLTLLNQDLGKIREDFKKTCLNVKEVEAWEQRHGDNMEVELEQGEACKEDLTADLVTVLVSEQASALRILCNN